MHKLGLLNQLLYPDITDRFLPDKAIDLVDQACATIRTEMGSNPTELDQVNRRVMQLGFHPILHVFLAVLRFFLFLVLREIAMLIVFLSHLKVLLATLLNVVD